MNVNRKGKDWERQAATLLTRTTGQKWHRTPCSGASATAQGIKDNKFKADVFCEHRSFENIIVECKCTKQLPPLFSKKSRLYLWIANLEKHADWLLMIKVSNNGVYAVSNTPKTLTKAFPDHDWELEVKINLRYIILKIK